MTLHSYSAQIMDLRDKAVRIKRITAKLEDILLWTPEKFTPEMAALLNHYNAKLNAILIEKARLEIDRAILLERSVSQL